MRCPAQRIPAPAPRPRAKVLTVERPGFRPSGVGGRRVRVGSRTEVGRAAPEIPLRMLRPGPDPPVTKRFPLARLSASPHKASAVTSGREIGFLQYGLENP